MQATRLAPSAAALAAAILLLGLAGAVRAQGAAPGAGTWHVAGRIAVGGDGFWDYLTVDTTHHRLFVSHGTHVAVVDLARDTVVGDLPNTPGVHGIALAPALNRGFVSAGRDSTVVVFDLTSLSEVARVNVGARNPDAIVYDPASRRVFTMNGGSSSTTALDATTNAVVGHVDLGGRPEFAVSDGRGRLYLNIEDKGEVVELDPKALRVVRRWPIAPCSEPSGLAIDIAHGRLFSVCDGVMAISDARAGKLLTTVPIGSRPDGAAFDPGLGLAFSSNGGDGTVTVVRANGATGYAVAATVPTQRGARTIAVDPRRHRLYLSTAEFGPPPAATAENPRPRPTVVPGSFTILVVQQ